MRTRRFVVSLLAVASIVVACGGDDEARQNAADRLATSDDTTESAPGEDGSGADRGEAVTIVGQNIMFDTTELSASVGETLEITFDNRDDGVRHNLHVRDTARGDEMTEITEGPVTQTLTVTFDQPGAYEYRCDVHPNDMAGTITVE